MGAAIEANAYVQGLLLILSTLVPLFLLIGYEGPSGPAFLLMVVAIVLMLIAAGSGLMFAAVDVGSKGRSADKLVALLVVAALVWAFPAIAIPLKTNSDGEVALGVAFAVLASADVVLATQVHRFVRLSSSASRSPRR